MKKSEWISRAAKNSGWTKKQIEEAYDALADVLCEVLGESVGVKARSVVGGQQPPGPGQGRVHRGEHQGH